MNRLYTPLEIAKDEIWKRWNDQSLKDEVEKFLGYDMPDFLKSDPRLILARTIASPNKEAVCFSRTAQKMNLKPLFVEYLSDKFVSGNIDKYCLSKLVFYDGKGRNGGDKVSKCSIVDICGVDGNPMYTIKTMWGGGLVDFHHQMFQEMMPAEYDYFDISPWLLSHGGKAKEYYKHYLGMFLCHHVLAEVFLSYNKAESKFMEEVFESSFDELEHLFGIKPLIVPVFHESRVKSILDDSMETWMYYHESMKQLIPDGFVRM